MGTDQHKRAVEFQTRSELGAVHYQENVIANTHIFWLWIKKNG